MRKEHEQNEDWVARDQGRIPTKGAAAAERASAGLGTSHDGAAHVARWLPARPLVKREPRSPESDKR